MFPISDLSPQEAEALFRYTVSENPETGEQFVTITAPIRGDSPAMDINFPEAIGGIPVTTLKVNQYLGYSPEHIRIPKTVTNIELSGGFPHVSGMIEIDPENPAYETDGFSLIAKQNHKLLLLCKEVGTYAVPDGVEILGYNAFKFMPLREIYLPDTVRVVDSGAFAYCSTLEKLTGGLGLTEYSPSSFKDTAWFQKSKSLVLGKILVRQEINTSHIVIPEGVELIGPNALKADYDNRGLLEKLTLPSTLRQIGEGAISGHINLEEVTLPQELESIGFSAFDRCEGLKELTIPASVKTVGAFAFSYCKELKTVHLEGVFSGKKQRSILTEDGEGVLSAGLFSGCISLKEIRIPEGFRVIGDSAFKGSGLSSAEIPDSVTEICSSAFEECFLL